MEIWWWLEPLTYTTLIIFLLGLFVAWIIHDSYENAAFVIGFIFALPFVVSGLLWIIYLLISVFVYIWKPYI